jgi:hypothetical protein
MVETASMPSHGALQGGPTEDSGGHDDERDRMSSRGTWIRLPSVAWVRGLERVVVMALADPIAAVPTAIAGSGLDIWLALDGGRSIDEICNDLAAQYDQPPAQIERVMDDFLKELHARGLVARIDQSGGGMKESATAILYSTKRAI